MHGLLSNNVIFVIEFQSNRVFFIIFKFRDRLNSVILAGSMDVVRPPVTKRTTNKRLNLEAQFLYKLSFPANFH